MKVVVTGASGYLGSAFVAASRYNSDLRFTFASRKIPADRGQTTWIDYESSSILAAAPDVIVHCAAMASAAACESDPDAAWAANVELTKRIAHVSQSLQAHFIYISTDLVFDGNQSGRTLGLVETETANPASVYGRTKLAGELAADMACERTSVLRISLLYGPKYGTNAGPLAWMLDAARHGKSITLFSDEWRTPLFVEDAVSAALDVARKKLLGLFHVGGPEAVSRVTFGEKVLAHFGYPKSVITEKLRSESPSTPLRPEDVSLDSRKLFGLIDMKPHDLDSGLERASRS